MENETVETQTSTEAEVEAKVEDTANLDNVETLETPEVEVLEKKEDDFKEKYFYIAAEMQNMQRRFDKEKENLLKFGSENILRDMLDVVDNFERTLGFIQADEDEKVKNIAVGVDMISKQFVEALGKHGLKKVEALGEIFDPNFHEALAGQPAEDKKESEIIQVHQNGYTLNERLVRPAKVVIVKNE
jgi:molecular chaperone GrpE